MKLFFIFIFLHRAQLVSAGSCLLNCDRGEYCDGALCIDCPVGWHQSSNNHVKTECDICPIGTFQDVAGQDDCKDKICSPGTYNVGLTATQSGVCVNCPLGKYKFGTNYISSCYNCNSCQPGYERYGCGPVQVGGCYVCAAGKYKTMNGQWNTPCLDCSPACSEGEEEISPCTSTTNRLCQIDNTAPVITIIGDTELWYPQCENTEYIDMGATCLDDVDGNIYSNVEVSGDVVNMRVNDEYIIHYNCKDSSNNAAIQVSRTVHVVDFFPSACGSLTVWDPETCSCIADTSGLICFTCDQVQNNFNSGGCCEV